MIDLKRVALCVTCVVDQVMPEIGVATVRLLRRGGYEVDFPGDQTCCGQPFFNSGFREQAINLAKRTIEIFEDQSVVVLPSGSCTTMIQVEYPHLLADSPEWHERARKLAAKTFELSEFLVTYAGWHPPIAEQALKVTYHDSCHMCRLLNLGEEPRTLLSEAGCEVFEMTESDRCCGFGGLFSIRMPEVSNAMTSEKLAQAIDTEAEILVTADPGCLMQMRGMEMSKGEIETGNDEVEHEIRAFRIEHIATVLEELTR